eukprot:6555049-Prymnesium_polylepis.2
MQSRGRDLGGILQQYEQFVKPSTETFLLPTKSYADVVVPRGAENTVAIDLIANHINGLLVGEAAGSAHRRAAQLDAHHVRLADAPADELLHH